jgi:DNA repair exonuclease SbcCD ATPase subunit
MGKEFKPTPQTYGLIKKIHSAIEEIREVAEELKPYTTDPLTDLLGQIEDAKEELKNVNIQLDEKKRVETLNLELKIKEDKQIALMELAEELEYMLIKEDDYEKLTSKVSEAAAEQELAVTMALVNQKAAHENAIKLKDLEIKAENATMVAEKDQLAARVSYLTKELDTAREQLKEAGDRTVLVAEALKSDVNIAGK